MLHGRFSGAASHELVERSTAGTWRFLGSAERNLRDQGGGQGLRYRLNECECFPQPSEQCDYYTRRPCTRKQPLAVGFRWGRGWGRGCLGRVLGVAGSSKEANRPSCAETFKPGVRLFWPDNL